MSLCSKCKREIPVGKTKCASCAREEKEFFENLLKIGGTVVGAIITIGGFVINIMNNNSNNTGGGSNTSS